MSSFELTGRRALVTGSSEGIGRAIADCLARAGADVTAQGLVAEDGANDRRILAADFFQPDAPERLISETGPVDILVSTVAVEIVEPFQSLSVVAIERQVRINFTSSLQLIQAVLPAMRKRGWGRIVTIGSIQERRPHSDMTVYAAMKGAQENLVRNLARQVAADGVTVNNVAPGVIVTGRNMDRLARLDYADQVKARIPMADFGRPEDVSGAVLLLCSDAGRYITGATIPVDGGMSL